MKFKIKCIKCNNEYVREVNFDKVSPKEFIEGINTQYICLEHSIKEKKDV